LRDTNLADEGVDHPGSSRQENVFEVDQCTLSVAVGNHLPVERSPHHLRGLAAGTIEQIDPTLVAFPQNDKGTTSGENLNLLDPLQSPFRDLPGLRREPDPICSTGNQVSPASERRVVEGQ
jgi:hypothetical protein